MNHSPRKKILLAVTGMSPQVVTETLYAMHRQGERLPDCLYIITTEIGKTQAWLSLGVGAPDKLGQLNQFCSDYGYPTITFEQSHVWVITDSHGNSMNDARCAEDHIAMADYILAKVRELTSDPNTEIHASLAGGRKTMTFFLGYAMSLYGREQDRLSHVLITPGYEGLPEFFYPTPNDYLVRDDRKGRFLNAREAEVTLAEIPFLRIREEMPERLVEGTASYSEVIQTLNQARQNISITIDPVQKQLICNGISVPLKPINLSFYFWFLIRAKNGLFPLRITRNDVKELEHAKEFYACDVLVRGDRVASEWLSRNQDGMTESFFEEQKSRILRALKNVLGTKLASRYAIQQIEHPELRTTGYGIPIQSDRIEIKDPYSGSSGSKMKLLASNLSSRYALILAPSQKEHR